MQRGLNWALRREAEPPPPQYAPPPSERPEAMTLAGQFVRGRAEAPEPTRLPPPPGRYRAAVAPPYQMFTPQVPLPLQAQARAETQRAAAQPASLYSPTPMAQASAAPSAPAAKPVRAAAPASPPPQVLATAPEPQRLAAAPLAPRTTGGATRLYSVHRGYGLEPDAIPEAPTDNRYVLIGPAASGVGGLDDDNDEAPDSRPGAL